MAWIAIGVQPDTGESEASDVLEELMMETHRATKGLFLLPLGSLPATEISFGYSQL
jgi:hypothetical protein